MREQTMTVDRGRFPDAVTPWERESWRAAALDWVAERLAAHGLRPQGAPGVRLRPWSVLVRVPVAERTAVWFKANPPGSAFEGPLTVALARWVPGRVLEPLAVDAGRDWVLLPDGGPLFRDVLAREEVPPADWEALLGQYADVQRALVPRARDVERLGVPPARTRDLPEVFGELLARNSALSPEERARLAGLRPQVGEWAAELAAAGVADTLDHADLHDGQLFRPAPGRFTFFDWGDATVSHPFCSFRVPAERARDRYGPGVLPRLLDAYLEPWTGTGRTRAELRHAARPAWRLSALGRAGSWGRMFPDAGGPAARTVPGAAEGAGWLLELLNEPPF
ncbi:aminoglycoside phosphotransferase family protein [Streptomyces sp. LP11]|uniref:Aminoglycoside phosphotransferase family protein n=1 Tax=Streptomyces pyxinicus TaxID=2970331 RepID=A0ABT2B2F5_9ACTN|nr:aminoglycoside phosphotransferase family protein [Streptomyces sp. LP11]MCS0602706.1 aminoglycoside phosphotransferase family protein [Streptomyces sp. LP11]